MHDGIDTPLQHACAYVHACMQILRMWLIVVEIVRHFMVVPLLLISIRECQALGVEW